MEEPGSPAPVTPRADDSNTAREIRHAVYLTGGLVLLSFGVLQLSGDLGQILSCVWQTDYCPGGRLSTDYIVQVGPPFVGALFFVGVAVLLLASARRTLRQQPPLF